MKYKLLLVALFTCLLANAQTEVTVFDPATYSGDAGKLDSIDGTKYLKIETSDTYPAFQFDEATDVAEADSITVMAAYAVHDGGEVIENIDLWLKVGDASYADVAIAGGPASATPVSYTATPVDGAQPAAVFQWNAGGLIGDTIWLGKITAYMPPPSEATNEFPIENVIVGSVDTTTDLSAMVNLSWDADSIYMAFVVADDSIVSNGTKYQVDNIEVYLDMDNSKNVKYPRNDGWMQDDPTYDTNDYQFRLVPDSVYEVNDVRMGIGGVRQVYTVNDTGYVFNLHVDWDSLLLGFTPVVDTVIGFDVLLSDCDDADDISDANRNQITMNSPTDKPFNDPSLFATLMLKPDGKFLIIPDEEAPSAVENLVATPSDTTVTLTWDPAEDNIAVMSYIISQDGTAIDTIYGKETGNSKTIRPLEPGNYTFSVKAVDNYGNVSASASATAEVVIVENAINSTTASIKVYPNPANSTLNILDVADIQEVSIISVTGSVVLKANTNRIDVANLKQGMYLIRVKAADGIYSTTFVKE